MPMKMGIHCKPIGHRHSASLDSRVRGNDGVRFFCKPIGHRHSASLDSRVCGNDGGRFFPRKRPSLDAATILSLWR